MLYCFGVFAVQKTDDYALCARLQARHLAFCAFLIRARLAAADSRRLPLGLTPFKLPSAVSAASNRFTAFSARSRSFLNSSNIGVRFIALLGRILAADKKAQTIG